MSVTQEHLLTYPRQAATQTSPCIQAVYIQRHFVSEKYLESIQEV